MGGRLRTLLLLAARSDARAERDAHCWRREWNAGDHPIEPVSSFTMTPNPTCGDA
jgi:hypothetical protein